MHTATPWTAKAKDTINGVPAYWWIQCPAGGVIGDVQSVNPADAALISAAPDLLAFAQAVAAYPGADAGLVIAAREVIAKALGE